MKNNGLEGIRVFKNINTNQAIEIWREGKMVREKDFTTQDWIDIKTIEKKYKLNNLRFLGTKNEEAFFRK